MGGGKRSTSAPAPAQHMYFLEGGLLVVGNLLKTDAWVHDEVRTHCSVCVQQFLPFRRRHHCRTCGEVVCGGCSSKREICLTDVNVQCATRVCTFCIIRATDASIKLNETAVRETLAMDKRRMSVQPMLTTAPAHNGAYAYAPPGSRDTAAGHRASSNGGSGSGGYASYASQSTDDESVGERGRGGGGVRQKQLSMWSMDSELTTGSVVQLWPQPIPDDESARLQIVRNSVIVHSENDPTMNLLVSIVARTLECPVAFIGILDDSFLWFKASVGWDRTRIPREDCVCSHTLAQSKPMVVSDTNADKRFHANNISLGADKPMRYYAAAPICVMGQYIGVVCALDSVPHASTSAAMKSTLEAVANIVSEVLEQRVDGSASRVTNSTFMSVDRMTASTRRTSAYMKQQQQQHQASETASDSSSERSSSTGTECGGLLDLNASLRGLNLTDCASSQGSSDDLEWTDPSPCMYLALSSVPPEYGEKIGVSMDFFQRLQSTLWCERPSLDGVKAFELFRGARQFTRSNTKLSGTCAEAVAHLLNYENVRIYEHVFAQVTRRYKLSAQTWMDEITLKPNIVSANQETLRVLTHSRQYPDGSTVVVAVNATKIYEADESDLLFGWFVAPCSLHDGLGSVNVSCIVTQPFTNQVVLEPNLSCDLMLRLRQCLPQQHYRVSPVTTGYPPSVQHSRPTKNRNMHTPSESSNQRLSLHDVVPATVPSPRSPPPPARPSTPSATMAHDYRFMETTDPVSAFDNQCSHETSASRFTIGRTISEESLTSFTSATSSSTSANEHTACAKIVPMRQQQQQQPQHALTAVDQRQVSNLNDNERMMLDLLDKTISTQEILAAQQHKMANVIDYHGSQLQRISSAIERVENLLADSGERLKRMPQSRDRRSMC